MKKECCRFGEGDTSFVIDVYQSELIDARMYVMEDGEDMLVIDPYSEPELSDGKNMTILLTHEHFDHISGINFYRERGNCVVIAGAKCKKILESENNGTQRFPFLFLTDREMFEKVRKEYRFPYVCSVDEAVEGMKTFGWHDHRITIREVPGHSVGSVLITLDDDILFSGDNLLGNGQEIRSIDTDPETFWKMIDALDRLSDEKKNGMTVFPGHGERGILSQYLDAVKAYPEYIQNKKKNQ